MALTKPDALHELDGCFARPVPPGHRRLAWDGVSFCVPSNWELAVYRFLRRGVSRIEVEDEYTIRIEAEWIRAKKRIQFDRIMKRYEAAAKPFTLKSEERKPVADLPENWHATHFVFKETATDTDTPDLHVIRHDLVTAFYLCPRRSIFCFFILHFLPEDTEDPDETVRRLAHSFQDHGEAAYTPWQLFDMAFKLPREFKVEATQFDIGMKLIVFGWKRRRFFLWHFSCAEMFLKEGVQPERWAAGHLNGYRQIHGPVFHPGSDGEITWRRRKPYFLGHREEIARLCYRYQAGCYRFDPGDKLLIWVYSFRRMDDLARLGMR